MGRPVHACGCRIYYTGEPTWVWGAIGKQAHTCRGMQDTPMGMRWYRRVGLLRWYKEVGDASYIT